MSIDNGNFNISRARQSMCFANGAYYPLPLAREIFAMAAKVDMIVNEKTDTQVLLIEYNDIAWAAWRGTQVSRDTSMIDILRNAKFTKTKWHMPGTRKARAHRGYAEAVLSVVGQVQYWVDKLHGQGKHVIGTGHSMGASLVTGSASIIDYDAVYAFGGPRFGNKHFATATMERSCPIFRVVHGHDIAPSYPHRMFGYRHAGERWQLQSEGALTKGREWGKDFWHFPYIMGKMDHNPAEYKAAMRKGFFHG